MHEIFFKIVIEYNKIEAINDLTMCEIPENFVTSDLVYHQRRDKVKSGFQIPEEIEPLRHVRYMFVFEHGDLGLAAHFLAERMHEPFEPLPIGCVAVQQSVRDEFIERVRNNFHQLKPSVAMHPHFERSLQELKTGGVSYVVADEANAPPFASPILVTDNISHLFFSTRPSGVVILHSFETIAEAKDAFLRETISIDEVIIFDESITNVYELAPVIPCYTFFLNCFDICILPILRYYATKQACSMMHNGFHFECIELENKWRIIVFPYSTTLQKNCYCLPGQCTCRMDPIACSER